MSRGNRVRRAVAEIRWDQDPSAVVWVGNRSIHHYWTLLSAYFRDVLLPPQRRGEENGVTWSWREADEPAPVSSSELRALRKRLADEQQLFAENLARGNLGRSGDAAGLKGQVNVDQLGTVMAGVVSGLVARGDPELTGFVCRTEGGLRLHSWGAAVPAHPTYPDTQGLEIAGRVLVAGKPARHDVVLESSDGETLAETPSDVTGEFRFSRLSAGEYRLRARTVRGTFPPRGLVVALQGRSVTDVVLADAKADDVSPLIAARRARKRNHRLPFVLTLLALAGAAGFGIWKATSPATEPVVASNKAVDGAGAVVAKTNAATRSGANGEKPSPPAPAQPGSAKAPAAMPTAGAGVGASGNAGVGSLNTGMAVSRAEPTSDVTRALPLEGQVARPTALPPNPSGLPTTAKGQPLPNGAPATAAPAAPAPTNAAASTPAKSDATAAAAASTAGGVMAATATPSASAPAQAPNQSSTEAAATNPTPPSDAPPAAETKSAAIDPALKPPAATPASAPPAAPERAKEDVAATLDAPANEAEKGRASETPSSSAALPNPETAPTATVATGLGENAAPKMASSDPVAAATATKSETEARPPAPSTTDTHEAEAAVTTAAKEGKETTSNKWTILSRVPPAPLTRTVRARLAPWRARVLSDRILPTAPMPVKHSEPVAALRARLLAEQEAKMPAAFREPVARVGVVLELPPGYLAADLLWRDEREIVSAGAEVRDGAAEISWPQQGPATERTLRLQRRDGAMVAEVRVAPFSREVIVRTSEDTRAWLLLAVRVESAANAAAENQFAWRTGAGAPIPVAWNRETKETSRNERSVTLPLGHAPGAVALQGCALLEASSGWALLTDVRQAADRPLGE